MSEVATHFTTLRKPPTRLFCEPIAARQAKQKLRRTFQPVRRRSILKGQEGEFWRPLAAWSKGLIGEFFDELATWGRDPDRNWAAITGKQLLILKALLKRLNWRTGELFPSWEDIQDCAGCCRDTVRVGLIALESLGLLERQRRYVKTGGKGKPGADARQTSNAYRFLFPPALLKHLPEKYKRLGRVYDAERQARAGDDAWDASLQEPRSEIQYDRMAADDVALAQKHAQRKRDSHHEGRHGRHEAEPGVKRLCDVPRQELTLEEHHVARHAAAESLRAMHDRLSTDPGGERPSAIEAGD